MLRLRWPPLPKAAGRRAAGKAAAKARLAEAEHRLGSAKSELSGAQASDHTSLQSGPSEGSKDPLPPVSATMGSSLEDASKASPHSVDSPGTWQKQPQPMSGESGDAELLLYPGSLIR